MSIELTPALARELVEKGDDFGHEMRVRTVLSSIGSAARIEHGGLYKDPVTGKERQFDFRVLLEVGNRCFYFAVESKNLHHPAIICGTQRKVNESFHDYIKSVPPSSADGQPSKSMGPDFWAPERQSVTHPHSPYRRDDFVGKSSLSLFTHNRGQKTERIEVEGDGEIHDRWSQALSSAHDLVVLASKGAHLDFEQYSVVLPIVVVSDGKLWQAEYDGAGKLTETPKPVQECTYFVGKKITPYSHLRHYWWLTHVHFFTLSGFANFCAELAKGPVPQRPEGLKDVSAFGLWFPNVEPRIPSPWSR